MRTRIALFMAGAFPLGLGGLVLAGALADPSRFALGYPGLRGIGINAALCYIASGAALLFHVYGLARRGGRIRSLLGGGASLIAAAVLLQFSFDFYPSAAPWRLVLNMPFSPDSRWPGGLSFTTAISFLFLGIVLARLDRIRGARQGGTLLALAVASLALAGVGAVGQLLGMDLLFSESPGSLLMSGPASWAMGTLSGGAIYLLVTGQWFRDLFAGREDRRIFFANLVFLFTLTLVSGLIGISLFERETMRNYQNSLAEAVESKAQLFESRILLTVTGASTATVISGVGELLDKPATPLRQEELREVARDLLKNLGREGVRMVRLTDRSGQLQAQAGEATELTPPGARLAYPYPIRLYWLDGWWVELEVMVFHGLRPVGQALFQSRLTGLDRPLSHTRGVGDVGRVRLCVPGRDRAICFPAAAADDEALTGEAAVASLALSGLQGVKLLRGERSATLAAYTPIGSTGLGMMHEVPTYELFHALRVQLLLALSAIVGFIIVGAFILHRRVYPMVRGIQFEKIRIQEILAHIPEGVITLDGQGVIQAANPTMERLFGYRAQEMEEKGIKGLIPGVCKKGPGDCAGGYAEPGGMVELGELTGVRRDGSHFPVEVAFNSFELDGRRHVIGIVRDVSERRKAEEALRTSEEEYRTILETAMDGFFVLDGTGRLRGVNAAFCRLLRYGSPEEMLSLSFADIEGRENWEITLRRLALVRRKGEDRFESTIRRQDGRVLDVEVSVKCQPGGDRFFCFMRDITKRKRAENVLKRSLASLAEAQRIARIGDWEWEISSDTLMWSEEAYRIFGLEPRELVGSLAGFLHRVYPDDRETVMGAIRSALDERRPYSIDHRIVLPDGSIRVVHGVAEVVFDKKWRPVRMRGTVQDITERKRIEEDLEHSRTLLRKLAAHIETVRENEKGRIAREIHDELGQLLTALRMDMALVRIQFGGDQPALKEKLESMTDLVDRTIRVVRSVASNLRPSALEVGIVPAIEWLVEDFQRRSGIMVLFTRFDRDLELDERRQIAVFRIVQESLTNVARYANASRVEISVAREDALLCVEVRDNGKGFDPASLPPHKAFGLMGIRERALTLGGECGIASAPGSGTTVSVRLPLEEAAIPAPPARDRPAVSFAPSPSMGEGELIRGG